MKVFFNLLPYFVLLLLLQGCNTLYNSGMINIEVLKPGKFVFPKNYRKVAVRYNNCNVFLNPTFSKYYLIDEVLSDTSNIDSVAAEIYYQAFFENLQKQHFFDSIIELKPGNTINTAIIDQTSDTTKTTPAQVSANFVNTNLQVLGQLIRTNLPVQNSRSDTIYIQPNTGLYTETDLKQIADSTGADLLISLDYFASIDGTSSEPQFLYNSRYVLSDGYWNVYDLKLRNLEFSGNRIDTVSWEAEFVNGLPPRRDAILNAAEISGLKFAEIVVPHWNEDERLYYRSGQLELAKTEPLIKEGKWLEAAKIWKDNLENPNKSIVAKCMYNLALACEMEGDVDAAIDWVVRSYQVFGPRNTIHALNCKNYIDILGARKMDFKRIEFQLNPNTELRN